MQAAFGSNDIQITNHAREVYPIEMINKTVNTLRDQAPQLDGLQGQLQKVKQLVGTIRTEQESLRSKEASALAERARIALMRPYLPTDSGVKQAMEKVNSTVDILRKTQEDYRKYGEEARGRAS